MKQEKINVLVACEESQRVCTAFRALGFVSDRGRDNETTKW